MEIKWGNSAVVVKVVETNFVIVDVGTAPSLEEVPVFPGVTPSRILVVWLADQGLPREDVSMLEETLLNSAGPVNVVVGAAG